MAEVIQFNCPVCATTLRLPLAMAARQGPCPHCQREIVAPDPYRGIGAHEAPQAVLPVVEPEPFKPFAETPPLVPKAPEEVLQKSSEPGPTEELPPPEPIIEPIPKPDPEPVAEPIAAPASETAPLPPASPIPAPPAPAPLVPTAEAQQRTILILSCLLAGAVGLAMGYAFGVRTTQKFMATPAANQPLVVTPKIEKPVPPTLPPEPPVTPPVTDTKPAPVTPPVPDPPPAPVIENPAPVVPEVPPAKPPEKVSAAAEASLRAFLEAPDWAARSTYVLYPEKVRAAMEAYSREVPDGPTAFKSIVVKQSQVEETTGSTLFVFIVTGEKFPNGIPVAVKETRGGWLVDWLAFVEFRDGLFEKFAEGPANKGGFFHLVATVPPPDSKEGRNENEHFSNYFIQSPLADKARLAYVKRNSAAAATLEAQTKNGRTYAPVLEVEKRVTPEKKDYLEILSVRADDWFPREN